MPGQPAGAQPGMTKKETLPRSRDTPVPEFCKIIRPKERGRREDRVRAAPAVSRAKGSKKAHTSIQVQRKQSGLPCAMVLTVSFVLSPVTGLIVTVAPEKLASQERNASIGASGPHDFVVRVSIVRPRQTARRRHRVHRIPHPTFVT